MGRAMPFGRSIEGQSVSLPLKNSWLPFEENSGRHLLGHQAWSVIKNRTRKMPHPRTEDKAFLGPNPGSEAAFHDELPECRRQQAGQHSHHAKPRQMVVNSPPFMPVGKGPIKHECPCGCAIESQSFGLRPTTGQDFHHVRWNDQLVMLRCRFEPWFALNIGLRYDDRSSTLEARTPAAFWSGK